MEIPWKQRGQIADYCSYPDKLITYPVETVKRVHIFQILLPKSSPITACNL